MFNRGSSYFHVPRTTVCHVKKVKVPSFKRRYILTKSVSVEAIGCEQLAQSRYAAAPGRGSNSRPLVHKSDALPLRHHATPSVMCHVLSSDQLNTQARGFIIGVSKTLCDFGHEILLKKNKLVNYRHIPTFCNLVRVPRCRQN